MINTTALPEVIVVQLIAHNGEPETTAGLVHF